MNEWQILESFGSEVEARVVESFLTAQGVEVQLLDSHMNGSLPGRGLGAHGGMRMMVRSTDAERARELLAESRRGSHLQIASDSHHPPVMRNPYEKWIVSLLIFAAVLVYMLTRFG